MARGVEYRRQLVAAISELIIAPNESILMDGPFSWKLGQ